MKKNLHLIEHPVRLHCQWLPTGNPRQPLACVWVRQEPARAASAPPSGNSSARLHLCA